MRLASLVDGSSWGTSAKERKKLNLTPPLFKALLKNNKKSVWLQYICMVNERFDLAQVMEVDRERDTYLVAQIQGHNSQVSANCAKLVSENCAKLVSENCAKLVSE